MVIISSDPFSSETSSESLKDTVLADVKGATVTGQGHDEYGNILINVDNATDGKDMTNTLGHEVYETYTQQTGGTNDASQEAIADMVGNHLANRIDQAMGGELANVGTGDLAGSNTVQYGNTRADNVGNAQVDYRRLTLNEAQTLDKVRNVIQGNSSLSAEEKQVAHLQLNALACAAVECANGVSEKDPLYKDLQALQQAGESLQEQGMNLSEILGEDAAGQFTHGWRDEFNDALTRNDDALTVVGGVVQTAGGVAGVAGGTTLAVGGALGCGPTAGLTCLAVPAGAGITALSQSEVDAGLDKVLGDYTHTEGSGVALSLSGTTHLGDVSPDIELLKGAGVVGLEILAAKVGGKALDKVLDKYQGVKSDIPNSSELSGEVQIALPNRGFVTGKPIDLKNAPEAPTPRYEISQEQAHSYLERMGVPENQIDSFVSSFDGPVYIRLGQPGETFGVYSGGPMNPGSGQFLTPGTAGQTPQQVISNLALPPNNPATHLNSATINRPIPILEGAVAPQNWTGTTPLPGQGWQILVPGGTRYGDNPPVTQGPLLRKEGGNE